LRRPEIAGFPARRRRMTGQVRNLDDLLMLGHGYQRSMILLCALKLGVFRGLSAGPLDASTLARKIGADAGKLSILLNALAALGLLSGEGGRFRNSAVARECLLPGPRSQESILLHHMDGWGDWGKLAAAIRGGREKRGGGDGGFQENFIRGMEENSRERAEAVARKFPLRTGERVLDLGGGPGTYAVAWAKAYPGTDVAIFDTPGTLRITRKILKEKGEDARVRLMEGDFLKDSIGGPYDFVWISQILHAFSGPECVKLLRGARSALVPGGRAAIQEFLVSDGKTSPPGPVFFSVHMVAVTEGGRAYTAKEIAAMMVKAGFREIAADPPDRRGVGIVWGLR
jgi:SAM-dependent methyltransferase